MTDREHQLASRTRQGRAQSAILDGAQQIVVPAFVSLLCICIVFVPMFYLPGVAGFLFVPMALAVVFAMIASFILSRTLVPTMAMYLLRAQAHHQEGGAPRAPSRNPLVRFQRWFERGFERLRDGYGRRARLRPERAHPVPGRVPADRVREPRSLLPFLGRNFFPDVDAGSIALHVRGPSGLRLEETAALFSRIERRSGRPFHPSNWQPSSTTSACRPARSTPPTTLPAPSGRKTATS